MRSLERHGDRRGYSLRVTVATSISAVLAFVGCSPSSYEYYNPLDPQEDALVDDVVARAAFDPSVEGELLSEWSGSKKSEVEFLNVFNTPVTSVEGLEYFPALTYLELNAVQLRGVDLTTILRLSNLDSLIL
ncbi:MAG: hypothetical protein WD492_06500 [Alkalispirochaeta sp.]